MKAIIVSIAFFLISNGIAQPFVLTDAFQIGSNNDEVVNDGLCDDLTSYRYITGSYKSASLSIGNFTVFNTNPGTADIFLALVDDGGNALWLKSLGTVNDDAGIKIRYIYDGSGDYFFTGYFTGSNLNMGGFTLINNGGADCFIAKFNAVTGNITWAKSFGGTGNEIPKSLNVTNATRFRVIGDYDATFTIATNTLNNAGSKDIFVVQYYNNGTFDVAKGFGSSGSDEAFDVAGSYICGAFTSPTLSFGTNTITNANSGTYDGFLLELDASLNDVWVNSYGGSNDDKMTNFTGLTCNSAPYILAGTFKSSSIALGNYTLTNSGVASSDNIFLANLTSSNTFAWAKSAGGSSDDIIKSSTEHYCKFFLTGSFNSPVFSIGSYSVSNINPGTSDVFIAGLDEATGNAIDLKRIGGVGNDQGNFITSGYQSVYTGGVFDSSILTCGSSTLINVGAMDVFISNMVNGAINGIAENQEGDFGINIYPNPHQNILTIIFKENKPEKISLLNYLGQIVYSINDPLIKQEIDLSFIANGIYFLKIQSENQQKAIKVIKE